MRCPLTYLESDERYSKQGRLKLNTRLTHLHDLPYSMQEELDLAASYADKLSIQGVQPKLSARLNIRKQQFEFVEKQGTYIIKPPHYFFQHLPENEDLTMRLAATVGILTPLHGLIYNKDGSLSYFIKRFDRISHNKKLPVEDFAQLMKLSRLTKYDTSMEKVASVLDTFCTFPIIEKEKLFRLVLFSFLAGNEDLHLKNFSLIKNGGQIALSPAYDLVNSAIVIKSDEDLALPLAGKKRKLKREHFVEYYAYERLGLNTRSVELVVGHFRKAMKDWSRWIDRSFLSDEAKENYLAILKERSMRMELA